MSVQTAKIRTGLRPAGPSDVKGMARLVDLYARQGLLLPRSPADMLRRLDQFLVIEEEGRVQAMGSLWPMDGDLAEIRTLAVAPDAQGRGLGHELVDELVDMGLQRGFSRLFCLTREPGFFTTCGFVRVGIEQFPQKIWKDCCLCARRERCDEIAMLYTGGVLP